MKRRSIWRLVVAFLILFALYHASEAVGHRMLHSYPAQAGLMIATVLAAWPLGRWIGFGGYDAYGLELSPRALGLLVAMLLAAFGATAAWLIAGLQIGGVALHHAALPALAALGMMALTTFVPSIAEDILTRGFFLRAANPGWNGVVFVLLSAALYTANHIYSYHAGWTEQARLFAMGLAYAAAAWRWQTLWAAVGLHWGYSLANAFTDPLSTITGNAVQGRWLTIGVHLALLAIILLIPFKASDARRR